MPLRGAGYWNALRIRDTNKEVGPDQVHNTVNVMKIVCMFLANLFAARDSSNEKKEKNNILVITSTFWNPLLIEVLIWKRIQASPAASKVIRIRNP